MVMHNVSITVDRIIIIIIINYHHNHDRPRHNQHDHDHDHAHDQRRRCRFLIERRRPAADALRGAGHTWLRARPSPA